jgi:purine-binding chemotaxis protein CheW
MTAATASEAVEGTVATAAPEWVIVGCDGRRFAFPLERVREILAPRPFTRLPGCGPAVCGLVGVRGQVLTVFDLGAVLSLRPAAGLAGHRLVLVEHGERTLGVAVDEIAGVAAAELGDAEAWPDGFEPEDLLGAGEHAGRRFLAVDPSRLLERLLAAATF